MANSSVDAAHIARAADAYMDAAERYMRGQRLGHMREAVIDNLHYCRERLQLELDAWRSTELPSG